MDKIDYHYGKYSKYGIGYLNFYKDAKDLGLNDLIEIRKKRTYKIKNQPYTSNTLLKWIFSDLNHK